MPNPREDRPGICPPEVRGYISQMEEIMRTPQYNHAGVPSQLAIDLWRSGAINSFAQFEACLRQMRSRVHFIAAPLGFHGSQYETTYPHGLSAGKPEYTLHVAVNGAAEASETLAQLSLTPEENVRRLRTTGVLTVPEEGQHG